MSAPGWSRTTSTASRWGQPGPGSERLVEPLLAEPLVDPGDQIGLHRAQQRPCSQADPPTQPLGGAFQPRRPLRVVRERQPGVRGQPQGHERGIADRQTQIQRLRQLRPGLIQAAPQDRQDAQLPPGAAASQSMPVRSARSHASRR